MKITIETQRTFEPIDLRITLENLHDLTCFLELVSCPDAFQDILYTDVTGDQMVDFVDRLAPKALFDPLYKKYKELKGKAQ